MGQRRKKTPAVPLAEVELRSTKIEQSRDVQRTPTVWRKLRTAIIGPPRDLFSPDIHHNITLLAFLAWVGLGADGLSSSAYGPEEAFKALGSHTHLALFLALATGATVFIIAVAYNQVIELFPSGGGGYKVATRLLGARSGLVSGAALVVDYVLTIAISIAAAVDAFFSFLPRTWAEFEIETKALVLIVLVLLNLRGVKESIKILLPIFLGFVLTHVFLIVYGIGLHVHRLGGVIVDSVAEAQRLSDHLGVFVVIALFIRAYAMGGGTYTGIEAVSNSVNMLKEPRVSTGKWTMFYMASSLAFTAAGIILLYLLWAAVPVEGKTLNAVVFGAVVAHWQLGQWDVGHIFLVLTLVLEAGLLVVAANTGFVGGPAVLANMSRDEWVPRRFSQLSERLVTKNGILLMGIAALVVLFWTRGKVDVLVVLYSINVFLTFSLTLLGMCVYWWRQRRSEPSWPIRLLLSVSGFVVTASILTLTVVEKLAVGGWITVIVTGALIGVCWQIRQHYLSVQQRLKKLDEILTDLPASTVKKTPAIREGEPAAVFFVSRYHGVGIHTLLNAVRMFPGRFQNFVFLAVGEVDSAGIGGEHAIAQLQQETQAQVDHYVAFCNRHGMAATSYAIVDTDPATGLMRLVDEVLARFPGSMFFAGTLVFKEENWLTRMLHNQTAHTLQRRMHLRGIPMLIMPMLVDVEDKRAAPA